MKNNDNLKMIDNIYPLIVKLKQLKRSGWIRNGIKNPESVAEHSFSTAILSLVLSQNRKKLNKEKVLIMSLLHDFAESLIGDITPHDKISPEQKSELELKTLKKIFNKVKGRQSYIDIFKELIENLSPEASFVKSIDKLEMALQAKDYQLKNSEIDFDEFFFSSKESIDDPEIKKLFNDLFS